LDPVGEGLGVGFEGKDVLGGSRFVGVVHGDLRARSIGTPIRRNVGEGLRAKRQVIEEMRDGVRKIKSGAASSRKPATESRRGSGGDRE
jgi:hypothetical protein